MYANALPPPTEIPEIAWTMRLTDWETIVKPSVKSERACHKDLSPCLAPGRSCIQHTELPRAASRLLCRQSRRRVRPWLLCLGEERESALGRAVLGEERAVSATGDAVIVLFPVQFRAALHSVAPSWDSGKSGSQLENSILLAFPWPWKEPGRAFSCPNRSPFVYGQVRAAAAVSHPAVAGVEAVLGQSSGKSARAFHPKGAESLSPDAH